MSVTGVLTFIFVLVVLVFFHELGHFLFAKLFRMKVEEFAIGMGNPKLRVYHDGETEYNLRAIPLGGFVRIKGMEIEDAAERRLTGANETVAEPASDNAGFETTNLSTMREEAAEVDGADADGFNNRPIYQRFWVIFGGPLFSFLFGYLLFCLIGATFGAPEYVRPTTTIEQVAGGKPAARAGIKSGDRITAINDKPITTGDQMVNTIRSLPGQPIRITLQNEKNATRTVTATTDAAPDPEKPGKRVGQLGFVIRQEVGPIKRLSLAESFRVGNANVLFWFQQMGSILTSAKKFGDNVGGPVEILRASDAASKYGGSQVASLIAQLSLSLGLFNLFPIPMLDGGHLLLMAIEKVRGKKLTAKQTERVFTVGFVFLATFAAFIIGRGLLRLVFPQL